MAVPEPQTSAYLSRLLEVLVASTRLGLTSFGGPIAHLGYYREEYVIRRKWLDEAAYADLVALCQFLPGPASSQVSIAIGITRAGILGGIAAWLGFTLPSALLMLAFAYGVEVFSVEGAAWLHGLKVVAVAVVAQAIWGMAQSLCPDKARATIAIMAAAGVLLFPFSAGQVLVIVLGGVVGWRLSSSLRTLQSLNDLKAPDVAQLTQPTARSPVSRRTGVIALALFFGLLIGLPLARQVAPGHALEVFDSFYRVGSLVFGGGHVVLPLLQAEVVPTGWLTTEQFVAGYGAAQALPGPLFTFAAYLGAVMSQTPNGWAGGLLALAAIFLPSFFLVVGALPFWDVLRSRTDFRNALRGINAAVVGLLLAALYTPVWTSAILSPGDFVLAIAAFGLLAMWRAPPWLVVALTALGATALSLAA